MKNGIKKYCDKCGVKGKEQHSVKRVAVHIQWPYYSYEGFDLCDGCLEKFETMIEGFFK